MRTHWDLISSLNKLPMTLLAPFLSQLSALTFELFYYGLNDLLRLQVLAETLISGLSISGSYIPHSAI